MRVPITIIIADDHPIVRRGLREVIEEESSCRVLAEAKNGQEALDAVTSLVPDVTILDIDMPGLNGFQVAREINTKGISTEIIFLTVHRDEDLFNEAIDLGARGFILKDSALTDIVECIQTVAAGDHYTSHSLTSYLVNRSRRALQVSESSSVLSLLTPTELRVLKLIAENLTSKEIGEQLFISLRTVEKHRSNICEKLQLRGSHSLLKFALHHKGELT